MSRCITLTQSIDIYHAYHQILTFEKDFKASNRLVLNTFRENHIAYQSSTVVFAMRVRPIKKAWYNTARYDQFINN